MKTLKIRRALITVSDKDRVAELGHALARAGAEIVATGRTAQVLKDAGLAVVPIEKVSGSPEAFQGRMKTLSFPVCSGILYRRGDASDEADLRKLSIQPIDCVVVNFYPFEKAAARPGVSRSELIEEIDIGGPTLVRAAAKNAPDVLVLTSPSQYGQVIEELQTSGGVRAETSERCALDAWKRIHEYDTAIVNTMAEAAGAAGPKSANRLQLRYGENPHQQGTLEFTADSPIAWEEKLTPTELSYNNILDLTAAYGLASDLAALSPDCTSVVIVKHNNACGVASIPKTFGGGLESAQMEALSRAWEGDPVSAFGGVVVFTDALGAKAAGWLAERFVELVAAPGLAAGEGTTLGLMLKKRKNLKAARVRRLGGMPAETSVPVPGGVLRQTADLALNDELRSVTRKEFPATRRALGRFGIAVCRSLKSNAVVLVREIPGVPGGLQLAGAGQGQPNRIEALKALAIPRAHAVLDPQGASIGDCVLVSDAFFPFRDTVDSAAAAGIRAIIQPGGSIKDGESVAACDEHGVAMAFTGVRHFRH